MRWQPSLQIIPHYESEPLYIEALITSIKDREIDWKPDLIISHIMGSQNLILIKEILIIIVKKRLD